MLFNFSPRLQAWQDLLKRYMAIWQVAWQDRRTLDATPRLPHEAQFLPAALELQETPPSPIPRLTGWLLMALFGCALLWAGFGKIDIVAVAHGKIIPNEGVKTIQPLEAAAIKRILVQEGQFVRAGDLLIELDSTQNGADHQRSHKAWLDAKLEAARTQALLAALDQGGMPHLAPQADIPGQDAAEAQRLAQSQHLEYQAKLASLDADITKRRAELETTGELVTKLQQTLPIARQRAEDYKNLLDQNYISKHGYLDREQSRIEQERDLAASQSKAKELQAAIAIGLKQRLSLQAEFRRSLLNQLSDAQQKAAQLDQEVIKAGSREQLMRLTAPVSGTVQQLAVHTVGGVVTPAQPLMVIVPQNQTLEIETWLENKDIGFVRARQEATVKIETFPYTKYGTLKGTVTTVSNDAVSDEKRGLVYQARMRLDRSTIRVEDKDIRLSPGMAVTAEIKTGQRRVIEYFLSPLLQYQDESLRER
jgi:hemolysin D